MNAPNHAERRALRQVPPLMGLATLMHKAFRGEDLTPLVTELVRRVELNNDDANALMDLSVLFQLQGMRDLGLKAQQLALQIQTLFYLPARQSCRIKLLALMTPGDLMANAPLPFLFENADVSLSMLYLNPGEPLPKVLPDHDVVLVAISESQASATLLQQLDKALAHWPRPVLLRPDRILQAARTEVFQHLADLPGVVMPCTWSLSRDQLSACDAALQPLPWIVRPLDSHAGHGLEKIDSLEQLPDYLTCNVAPAYYVSPFVPYQDADGLYRKYRVVLIDGVPFAGHMGVSSHWMIHYLNAGMTESADKRAEEARFMAEFETDFAQRHAKALHGIYQRMGLEYLVIDCAQTADGELLVFEVDPAAVVHSMDPTDLFPYKPAAMQKVFAAFHDLLLRTAQSHPSYPFAVGSPSCTPTLSH